MLAKTIEQNEGRPWDLANGYKGAYIRRCDLGNFRVRGLIAEIVSSFFQDKY